MDIFRLKSSVLRLRNKPAAFLNGLTSNVAGASRNAFLNLHGRIIAAFETAVISDDEILMVIHADYARAVADHLDRYLKLAGVVMEMTDSRVYFDCAGRLSLDQNDIVIPQEAGRLVLSIRDVSSTMSEDGFCRFRLDHGIALHGVDYTDEMILNVGSDRVSFTKGCYLGQEFVSKVYHRSKPTWKLVVRFEDECSPEERAKMTSKVTDPSSGRTRGFVFVRNE